MNKNKALGSSLEHRVVDRAKKAGLSANIQPGSGVYKEFPHDAVIENVLVECKARTAQVDAKGQRYIRLDIEWLNQTLKDAEKAGFAGAALVVNAKGSREPIACITLSEYLDLLKLRSSR